MRVRYNTVKNTYYVSNGPDIKNWSAAASSYSNIQYKIEHDWQMCYLARTNGSAKSFIEWLFRLEKGDQKLKKVDIRFEKKCYESGKINLILVISRLNSENEVVLTEDENISKVSNDVSIRFANGIYSIDFSQLENADLKTLKIRAEMSLGNGENAWQHTQLFRQSLKDTNICLFDIGFDFD